MSRAALLAAVLMALAGCATVTSRAEHAPLDARAREDAPALAPEIALGPPDDGASGATGRSEPAESAADLRPDVPSEPPAAAADLGARLAARARGFLGRRGPFRVAGERFNDDCSGLVQAIYAAEGIDLRGLMERAAPAERRGVKAAWLAARTGGEAFGAEAQPQPGDLVFWNDTFDRNRNRKADDRLTHVGIVESFEGGTVHFVHRGARNVARGVMTLARPNEASDPDGRRVNSVLRARSHPVRRGGLAGQLFAGYARIGEVGAVAKDATRPAATASASRVARARTGDRAAGAKRKHRAGAAPERARIALPRRPAPQPSR